MGVVEPLQASLKRLALVAMSLSTASASAIGGELATIPERAVEAVIDESEAGWDRSDRLRVLHLLTLDPRESVRRHVAISMAAQPDAVHAEAVEPLLARLAADPSPQIRELAAADLVALLAQQSPLERTDLVCRWATDADGHKRLALVTALLAPVEINGTRTALEHLEHDDSPDVRAAARRARATRRG